MQKKDNNNNLDARRLSLKRKIRGREMAYAAWTSLAHPSITEMFTRSGVDFVGIDIEHSTISQEQSQRIIAAAQATGSICLPRIASHNMEMIKRLLDSGADGIIAPMVSSRAEVDRLVSWIKYPPEGSRSFGISRGQGYGFDFETYTSSWNEMSTFIVQIESKEGVENAEEIISHEGVDGAMIGPYDLSGSYGIPGRFDDPVIVEATGKVIELCRRLGKGCGTQVIEPSVDSIGAAVDAGYTFVVLASDIFILWKWSERIQGILAELRNTAS